MPRHYRKVVDKVSYIKKRGYVGVKRKGGLTVPFPEPQMDWEVLRLQKRRCEDECLLFDYFKGGCLLGLMPNAECPEFQKRTSVKQFEQSISIEVLTAMQPEARPKGIKGQKIL